MAHVSLYRKHRPQTFEDVVGQEHVTRTLRNAVREGSVAHAYLFAGPRGTGKTTTARILAKALLCEVGPTAEPDDTCAECRDVSAGNHPDVHELDAASRTQVENVREEIIGRVPYAPTRGAWKVYIIDEVHMLSTHSFNALLKTIEEPPSHTVFVLCTTHPHKVPETIHSRCQRFDFHRIGVQDIADRLAYVADDEGIEAEDGVMTLIARHAAGGMRDALGALEQLSAFTGGRVTLADVQSMLGEVDTELLFELAGMVERRDVAAAFRFVAALAESGTDLAQFVKEFVGHVRDLYVTSVVGDPAGLVDTTEDDLARLASQASAFGQDRLARCLDLLGELSAELRIASDARLALEVTLTRMARPAGDLTLEALAERVSLLEVRGAREPVRPEATDAALPIADPSGSVGTRAGGGSSADRGKSGEDPDREGGQEAGTTVRDTTIDSLDRSRLKRAWPHVMKHMSQAKRSRATLFAGVEVDIDADGGSAVLEFPADRSFALDMASEPDSQRLVGEALKAVLGEEVAFRYQLGRGPVRPDLTVDPASHATPVDGGGGEGSKETGGRSDDRERRVIEALGAEVVAGDDVETS